MHFKFFSFPSIPLIAVVLLAGSSAAHAQQITWTHQFEAGHTIAVNGTETAAGPITIVGTLDASTPDLLAGGNGEFALDIVTFTGAGFVDEPVVTELSVYTLLAGDGTQRFSFVLRNDRFNGTTGWNGTTDGGDFSTDVDDLTALVATPTTPWTSNVTSTFWDNGLGVSAWTLQSGDTVGADIGSSSVNGLATIEVVPEPSSLALMVLGGLALVRRRRH